MKHPCLIIQTKHVQKNLTHYKHCSVETLAINKDAYKVDEYFMRPASETIPLQRAFLTWTSCQFIEPARAQEFGLISDRKSHIVTLFLPHTLLLIGAPTWPKAIVKKRSRAICGYLVPYICSYNINILISLSLCFSVSFY